MINQKIEELKTVLAQDGPQNVYLGKEVTLENLIHFCSDENDMATILTKYGIQDSDIFKQALYNEIVTKARARRPQQQNFNQNANRGGAAMQAHFQQRYRANDFQEQAQEEVFEEVRFSEEFEEVYKQARIIEFKKTQEEETQEIQDTDIENVDPSYDSLLRGVAVYNQITGKVPSIVRSLQTQGFNWQDFLSNKNVLEDYCINLNQLAKDGKIDKVIGREDEILMAAQVLGKKKKANPIFLGKAGVGKTAIAEGLAYKIEREPNEVPHTLANAVIFSLNTNDLVSGASFRGQFEERIKELISELKKIQEEGEVNPILFIDEIHSIVGTGGNEGKGDMANIIKTALSKGDIRCMGATTTAEYNKHIKNDHALRRRFHPIRVEEPSRAETIEILTGAKSVFEDRHDVEFSDESIVRCVDLAILHINDTALPDKAIDLLDFCGSKARIEGEEEIFGTHMEQALARYRKIPLERIMLKSEEAKEEVPLAPKLKERVYGQDKALETICDVIETSQGGMGEENKPIGSFLLTGPTGVGKTETAKQLADLMGVPLQRIDMAEYKEKHSVSKLTGTTAGYVGYGETPLLTKMLTETPHCVLLLDEMEKAHPDIFDIFLSAMDSGIIRDGQQEELSFENVVIIMTSNAGGKVSQTQSLGLTKNTSVAKSKAMKEITTYFSPEFIGRLDSIIEYNSLPVECMDKIVDKKMLEVNSRTGLVRNGLEVVLDKSAKDYLIQVGYDKTYGARPLENKIKVLVVNMLAKELRHGKLKNVKDKKIKIIYKNDKLSLVIPRK
jgi:ATP-dependent Clp protease ATP-binding subunit ClpA